MADYILELFAGLGDTLSQYHFVQKFYEKYGNDLVVRTAWPQLFWNMPIRVAWLDTILRTQEENLLRQDKTIFARIHKKAKTNCSLGYADRHLALGMTIAESFAERIKVDIGWEITDYSMDLPVKPEWIEAALKITGGKKFVLVRKPTVRNEYFNTSRNPTSGYIERCVNTLDKSWLRISVGHNKPNYESVVRGDEFNVDMCFDSGEIPIETLVGLAKIANLIVTPMGYMSHLGPAVRSPIVTVFGGHVSPTHIWDKRMYLEKNAYVAPEPFCDCFDQQHNCTKVIDNLEDKFAEAVKKVTS